MRAHLARRGTIAKPVGGTTPTQYLIDVLATPTTAQWGTVGTGNVVKPERQPTAVSDTTNRISCTTSPPKINEYIVNTPPTLAGGEVVQTCILWVYGDAPVGGATWKFQPFTLGAGIGSATTEAPTLGFGWRSSTYTGTLTQAQINDLHAHVESTVGSATASRVYAVYFELNTLK